MPRTIRWKLIFSISVPLLITYLGMLAWDYYRQRSSAMEQMQQMVLDRAEGNAANLDARLMGVMQAAQSVASALEARPLTTDVPARAALATALRQNPWVASAAVVLESQGKSDNVHGVIARRGEGPLTRFNDVQPAAARRDWYVRAKEGAAAAWTEPYTDASGDRRVCTYVVPIFSSEQFRGVVAVNIAVDELRHLRGRSRRTFGRERGGGDGRGGPASRPAVREGEAPPAPPPPPPRGEGPGEGGDGVADEGDGELPAAAARELQDFGIFDANGRSVMLPMGRTPPRETIFETAEAFGQTEVAQAARAALGGQSHVVRITALHNIMPNVTPDAAHWIAFAPIPATGWALVTSIPESTVMGPILSRIGQRAAFLLGGSVVLLMVVLLVSIRISRPIEQMAGAVDRLAAGDLDARVTEVKSRDELGRLAHGFNQMTRQLKAHVAALTEQTVAREKVESELRIARQIQTDMLPKTFPPFPERPEFDLYALNLPARRVAGDFYDFFFTAEGLLTIAIADVSGKGVPAALLMAVTRTIVRNLAMSGLPPREIAERTNAMLIADTSRGMFVTMLLCQYEPATGKLRYVNAGHPPPYRLASGNGAAPRRCCEVTSPLLGVDASGEMGPFEECEETLAPGEAIFLYTDGVPDARTPAGQAFGEAGLVETLRGQSSLAPETLCRALADHLERFQDGQRQDDITLVVLRRSARV